MTDILDRLRDPGRPVQSHDIRDAIAEIERLRAGRPPTSDRLTAQQIEILRRLVRGGGAWVTRAMLVDHLYGERDDGGPEGAERTIDVQLCRVRKVVGAHAIGTLYGVGYRVVDMPRALDVLAEMRVEA